MKITKTVFYKNGLAIVKKGFAVVSAGVLMISCSACSEEWKQDDSSTKESQVSINLESLKQQIIDSCIAKGGTDEEINENIKNELYKNNLLTYSEKEVYEKSLAKVKK